MITLLNYEKAQGGDYVCHFSVGSTEMTYAEAEKEFKKISDSAFVVSPETMSISFTLGVPGYGSTITMHYNTGVTVFYKAGEYTSDVVRGDEILDDPGAVDVSWKTMFESSDDGIPKIFPKTHDGKKYYAMTGCIAPEIVPGLEITENGHYGWPLGDKSPNEWTDEEWDQGPITDVVVNVPTQSATILDDPGAVDVKWKTIIANNGIITAKTYNGTKYDAMTGCAAPITVGPLKITENGHYGWPVDKDPNEWTDEEWGQGPITDVVVNVHPAPTIGTVIGTPTQVQEWGTADPGYETLYCIEYDALKTIIDSSDELVFKLSDSQYTRPMMGLLNASGDIAFEIVEYLDRAWTTERTAPTKFIYVIDSNKQTPRDLDYEQRRFIQDNVPSKIPYNIYTYFT